jgi:hypothetical protein
LIPARWRGKAWRLRRNQMACGRKGGTGFMRSLNIQIQTVREPSLDVVRLRHILEDLSNLKPLVESTIRDEGSEYGLFMNCTYQTENLHAFWAAVQERLLSVPEFGEKASNCSTIIASRGGEGWEDYLLLQHFDPNIETQSLA